MKKFKISIVAVLLLAPLLSVLADDANAVTPTEILTLTQNDAPRPAPVNIAPTIRAKGGLQEAAPVITTASPVPSVIPSAVPAGIPSAKESPQVNSSKTNLTFMDSKLFDMRLGKELESNKDVVEIDISGRIPLSNIPQRIDKWVVLSAEEGTVELLPSEPKPKTRFIFSLIPMVFNAIGSFKSMQEEKMFDHAKRYDTKIYYKKDDAGDTLIEKIVLTRRKAH